MIWYACVPNLVEQYVLQSQMTFVCIFRFDRKGSELFWIVQIIYNLLIYDVQFIELFII